MLRSQLCSAESLRAPALRAWAERLRPMWGRRPRGDVPPQDVGVALHRRGAAGAGHARRRAHGARVRRGAGAAGGALRRRRLSRRRHRPAARVRRRFGLDGLRGGVGQRTGGPERVRAVCGGGVRAAGGLPPRRHERASGGLARLRLCVVVVRSRASRDAGGRDGLRGRTDGLPAARWRGGAHDRVPGVVERGHGRGGRDRVLPAPRHRGRWCSGCGVRATTSTWTTRWVPLRRTSTSTCRPTPTCTCGRSWPAMSRRRWR